MQVICEMAYEVVSVKPRQCVAWLVRLSASNPMHAISGLICQVVRVNVLAGNLWVDREVVRVTPKVTCGLACDVVRVKPPVARGLTCEVVKGICGLACEVACNRVSCMQSFSNGIADLITKLVCDSSV